MKTLHGYISLIILSLLFSCKTKVEEYPLSKQTIDFFGSYNNGSWWKYRDSSATGVDTIVVTLSDYSSIRDCIKFPGNLYNRGKEKCYELITYKIEGGNFILYAGLQSETHKLGSWSLSYSNQQSLVSDAGGAIHLNADQDFIFVPCNSTTDCSGYGTGEYVHLAEKDVLGSNYKNVIKISKSNERIFYVAKSIGIIEYEEMFHQYHNYKLIDYEIN